MKVAFNQELLNRLRTLHSYDKGVYLLIEKTTFFAKFYNRIFEYDIDITPSGGLNKGTLVEVALKTLYYMNGLTSKPNGKSQAHEPDIVIHGVPYEIKYASTHTASSIIRPCKHLKPTDKIILVTGSEQVDKNGTPGYVFVIDYQDLLFTPSGRIKIQSARNGIMLQVI